MMLLEIAARQAEKGSACPHLHLLEACMSAHRRHGRLDGVCDPCPAPVCLFVWIARPSALGQVSQNAARILLQLVESFVSAHCRDHSFKTLCVPGTAPIALCVATSRRLQRCARQ
jgi:hypothetical protein